MHSTVTRAQNVFGFFTTVAFVVAGLIAVSDIFSSRNPSAKLSVKDVQTVRGKPHYYSPRKLEYAHIRFNLDADLSSLFTWNTKQVFVWVSASWPNSTSSATEHIDPAGGSHGAIDLECGEVESALAMHNEAVIWDSIITNPSADHLQNIGPVAMKKLKRSAKGRGSDPSRGLLKLKNQKSKYHITTPSGKLGDTQNVVLTLHYNVQPWVGVLTWTGETNSATTKLPTPWTWRWKPVRGGKSDKFSLPPVKAAKKAGASA